MGFLNPINAILNLNNKIINFRGYLTNVLGKTKTFEEITMESKLQSWLKAHIAAYLILNLAGKDYEVTAGELGINLSKQDKRGADISIFASSNFTLDEFYSDLSPEVVIEIDVKAELDNNIEFNYMIEKIEDYHNFGIKNVIWVFTKIKKVFVAQKGKPSVNYDWHVDIPVIENLTINIGKMIENKGIK